MKRRGRSEAQIIQASCLAWNWMNNAKVRLVLSTDSSRHLDDELRCQPLHLRHINLGRNPLPFTAETGLDLESVCLLDLSIPHQHQM